MHTVDATVAAAMERDRRELAGIIARHTPGDGSHATAVPSLSLHRRSGPTEPMCALYQPALTVAVQGAKRVVLGGRPYLYDSGHYLVTSIDLPVAAQVVQASPEVPNLCLALDLDARRMSALMSETALPRPRAAPLERGLSVSPLSAQLLNALLRLARLLDSPEDIPILAPLVEREVLYRLLTGDQGMRLRHIAVSESRAHQVARAIDWLKRHYAQPLRIEALAQAVNMSTSSLHHHFKAITALSPLQYQKQLRLQEARRLMLTELLDAAAAGRRVGYESASQFSREYSRLYGAPPLRDIALLRSEGREVEPLAR